MMSSIEASIRRHERKLWKRLKKGGLNMWGNKVFLTGLFLALIAPILVGGLFGLPVDKLGAVVALVGIILIWLDK